MLYFYNEMEKNNQLIQIEPKILVWARTRLNLSIQEVANSLNKDTKIVSDWEKGDELPTLSQLEKLAYQIYKLPLAVFFMSEPPEEPSLKKQFRTIPEHEFNLLPSALILKIKEGQYYQEVLKEIFNEKNPVELPIFRKYANKENNNPIGIANSIREELKINKSALANFGSPTETFKYYREQIEKSGIFVFQQTLKNYCRGYSLFDDEFPIIIINSSEISDTGKSFTLFHELAHLIIKTGGLTNNFTFQSNDQLEIYCNLLASHILVNNEDLLKIINVYGSPRHDWDENSLMFFANEFKVSKEVILRKLLDMGLASTHFYNSKRQEWSQTLYPKKKDGGGEFYRNKLSKLGNYYTSIIFNNLYSGRINPYQASEYLGIKVNQLPGIEKLILKNG
jgi:Zn-dependent peptidase ImmA (M78 family)